MSDVDSDTPVSSKGKTDSLVPDSLEFDANTTPVISKGPQDPSLSLQELIDAELTNRLSPQDSLEVTTLSKDGQADLESLISSDSIEDELRIKKEGADQLISLDSVDTVNIDVTNSNTLSLNLDDLAKAEVESGIEVLSPNKVNVDDLSLPSGCHDSLESSSDLPGSPSGSSPDPLSPSAAQQTFSHQTLIPTDDPGLFSSTDKSNSSSAEDSTAATTIIPQSDDLLGLDSSFTNVSYSVQTISNSSMEENLLESFSSIPSTFQKQGTLEGYEEGYEAFEAMDESATVVYMDDEKGAGTETSCQVHVVSRNTDLSRSYSIVSEGISAEEELLIESNLITIEEGDQVTNFDDSRELGITKNSEHILDFDTVIDKGELPSAEDLEIFENRFNENSTKESKDPYICKGNQEPKIEFGTEEVEVATEVIMQPFDLLSSEKVTTPSGVKIIVTEENGEIISDDCDLKGAPDGEFDMFEDNFNPSHLEGQMVLEDILKDIEPPSSVEIRLLEDSDRSESAEVQLIQGSQDYRNSIKGHQEARNTELSDVLIIVEDVDKVQTESITVNEDEETVLISSEEQTSISSSFNENSVDVSEDAPQDVIPEIPSNDLRKSDFEDSESTTSTKTEPPEAEPDAIRQDLVETSSDPQTSDNAPSTPGKDVLCTEQTHGSAGGDELLTNDNRVCEKEAPNTMADMEGKAYKDEEEGWPGNEDEDDVPSSRLKKNEEEDEEQLGEDEDEDAARTAFLMKMAEGYEGEEREAVEAFIRSKLEQEKVEKATAEDEENKAPEDGGDEGEKKKKKKKRSEGGEKKSRKKKKKSDDKIPEDVEESCSASSSHSSPSSTASCSSGPEDSENDEIVPKIEVDLVESRCSEEIASEIYEDEPLREESFSEREDEVEEEEEEEEEYDESHSLTNGHSTEAQSYTNGHHAPTSDECPDEELLNVNVKKLTSAYLHSASNDDSARSSGSEGRGGQPPKEEVVRPSVSIHELMDAYTSPTKTAPSKQDHPRIDKELPPQGTLHSRKNAYVQSANKSRPDGQASDKDLNGAPSPLKEEVNLNVSLTQLRETYCNTARSSSARDDANSASSPASKTSPVVSTGVKIKDLRRSYSDLTRITATSTTTTAAAEDRFEKRGRENDTDSYRISVRELRASYGDLSRLADSPPIPVGRTRTPSPSPRSRSFGVMSRSTSHQNLGSGQQPHSLPPCHTFSTHSSSPSSSFKNTHKSWEPKQQLQAPSQLSSDCRMCGKQVFQMEKIVAEKATWHKNCFRCKECNKNLTLETYQSHEGTLYCKPHFKELFRPKAVVEDEATARKDRPSDKPDYGLEELQTNVRAKFAMFETASKEEEQAKLEPVSVRRSQSLLNRVARFQRGESGEEYGVENSELGEYDEDEDDEEEEEEEFDDENADPDIVRPKKKKKERPVSIGNMGDLKAAWETKNRREEMAQNRKEELAKFRQMLCAGKNLTLKEMFESGAVDGEKMDKSVMREEIKIDGKRAASSLKEKFEKGRPFTLEDEDNEERKANGEREEVEEIFKEAETAHKARNIFKQIDSHVTKEGLPVMRSQSFAQGVRENRLSKDGLGGEDQEIGRDPNLIRCSDNYQDDVDCKNTRNVLAMFKKMELQGTDDGDEGPKPLKRFTPPPDGEYDDDDDEEYSDEEYSDEEYSDEEDEDEEDSESGRKPKYQDEVLEMAKQARKKSPQSAKKAASLRAKFERWESDQNEANVPKDGDEECMPSIDTAKNLKAMFETKAQEVLLPKVQQPKVKVNRFVGGGGEKCIVCDKTVYAMEKLELQGKILHKSCFRCGKCNTKLSMGSFSMGGDRMYCTTHYKQLFAEKGTYEVFSPNGSGKWARKIEATPNNEETEPKSNS